jgi:hypothetical protein
MKALYNRTSVEQRGASIKLRVSASLAKARQLEASNLMEPAAFRVVSGGLQLARLSHRELDQSSR